MKLLTKVLGDPNAREIKRLGAFVSQINELEESIKALDDEALKNKTRTFRERLAKGDTLDDLLPEAFAVVREVSWRVLSQRQYDVQMIGGIVLHRGMIAEMRTGEGKTLTATAPVYLNALTGKGVHVITVNDYLARRDAVWMGQAYYALGLSVSVIQHGASFIYDPNFVAEVQHDESRDETGSFRVDMDYLRPVSKKEAYNADITYGTNNEFGFDYLRDNMATSFEQKVQRPLHFCLIDEVDSILIDEARTPLIISAPAEEAADMYYRFAELIARLKQSEDYEVDEKMRSATLTEAGIAKMEGWLGVSNMYDQDGVGMVHHLEQALKAHSLFKLDKDYVVHDGEVIIVDQFTGRLMQGRRYSEGLHQAIEAKERVDIQRESVTLATITFQNLFRLYEKLSGMTGTAETEAEEFSKIYKLEVVSIPTNRPNKRLDLSDRIYKTELGKFQAVIREIRERHEKGQPVLLGTASIEKNELLSEMLKAEGLNFNMLNAKNHEREAEYIAQAGSKGAITVATNMAGRGVDIILGGNPPNPEMAEEIKQMGGLFVLGTERHDARRIDNQLRGRAGRQGDPGTTQFYVSTDDDLARIFGGDRMKKMMESLKIPEDMPIENKTVSKLLEGAQKRVEGHNFDLRKHLLEYDDVLNKQRMSVYKRRDEILKLAMERTENNQRPLKPSVLEMIEGEIEQIVAFHTAGEEPEEWDLTAIEKGMKTILPASLNVSGRFQVAKEKLEGKKDLAERRTGLINDIVKMVEEAYAELEEKLDTVELEEIEKVLILRVIDDLWISHLQAIDYLRHGVRMQGYGQRDPLVEYKKEAFRMYHEMLANMQSRVANTIFKIKLTRQAAKQDVEKPGMGRPMQFKGAAKTSDELKAPPVFGGPGKAQQKVGRNDPCPCGAVKPDGTRVKYKHCHGKNV
jgi:preprotein translocase subunit SecA